MLTLLTNMPREVLMAQLKDGLILLVLGMGTVFVFLVILIFATKFMSRIVNGMGNNDHAEAAGTASPQAAAHVQQRTAQAPTGDDAAVAAAIAAAYDRSRN